MTDQVQSNSFFSRLKSNKAFYPLLSFVGVLFVLILMTRLTGRPPVIKTISPEISRPGEFMVIEGEAFGSEKAQVYVSGIPLTARMIKEWSDKKISLILPDNVSSGWVYIKNSSGHSNSILFTNIDQIPRPAFGQGSSANNGYIQNVSPSNGPVGTLVTIKGRNFGAERKNSLVYFSRNVSAGVFTQSSSQSGYIACQERDFDYEFWSDKEIKIRVPDGASSGMMKIVNSDGESNAVYFDVNNQSGVGYLEGRRIYQLKYGFSISGLQTKSGGYVDFNLPLVSEDARTTNIVYKANFQSWNKNQDYETYRITEFSNISEVTLSASFEAYTYKTKVFSESETNEPLKDTALFKKYTSQEGLVTPKYGFTNEVLYNVVLTAQPYSDAKKIYNFLINRLKYNPFINDMNFAEQYQKAEVSSLGFSVILASCYRRAGIPARVVSGLLVTDILKYTNRPHAWVEFYYNKMGWIPVDPSLGSTAAMGMFNDNVTSQEFYFGNLDAQHIAFAHKILVDEEDGTGVYEAPRFSSILMNKYIKPSSEVITYLGFWKPFDIGGIY